MKIQQPQRFVEWAVARDLNVSERTVRRYAAMLAFWTHIAAAAAHDLENYGVEDEEFAGDSVAYIDDAIEEWNETRRLRVIEGGSDDS